MATSRTSRSIFELALAAVLGGQGCAQETDGTDAGPTFVAFAPDFANYTAWESFDLGDGADASAEASCVHVSNVPREAFLNHAPPHGSTEFPVGTIIVKEMQTSPTQVFGMVKRGGGFGADAGFGCDGWEWFGLSSDTPSPSIEWRGIEGAMSTSYVTCGPCAGCHSAATTNDCVLAPQMSLSQW
jgi:hypothetical protein